MPHVSSISSRDTHGLAGCGNVLAESRHYTLRVQMLSHIKREIDHAKVESQLQIWAKMNSRVLYQCVMAMPCTERSQAGVKILDACSSVANLLVCARKLAVFQENISREIHRGPGFLGAAKPHSLFFGQWLKACLSNDAIVHIGPPISC